MKDQRNEAATKQDVQQVKQDVKRVRQDLGAKLDANAIKIDANAAKIDANAAKIDANAAKIDEVEKRLSAKIDLNTEKLDRVIRQVVENSVRLDQMVTRAEFNSRMDELIAGQDKMISLFTNLDQERIATNARLDRVEIDVKSNKSDIEKIKTKLAMP